MSLFGFTRRNDPAPGPQVQSTVQPAPGTIPDSSKRIVVIVLIVILIAIMAISTSRKSDKAAASNTQPTFRQMIAPRQEPAQDVATARQQMAQMQAEYQRRQAEQAQGNQAQAAASYQNGQQNNQAAYQQTPAQVEDPIKVKMRELEVARDFEGPSVFTSDGAPQQWGPGVQPPNQIAASAQAEPNPTTPPAGMAGLEAMEKFQEAMAAKAAQNQVTPSANLHPVPPPEEHKARLDVKTVEPGEYNLVDDDRAKDYVIFEGTIIEAVLVNRLEGEFAGPVEAQLTTDVLSHDGKHILIPAGTKALGEATKVGEQDQRRLAVVFHRLLMPDGYSVGLDQFKGLDQEGSTGLHDKVNHHYMSLFGASIAIGLLTGLEMANSSQSILTQQGAYKQGLAEAGASEGMQILGRMLNRLPTITIREGSRLKIFISADLLVPAFEHHKIPGDI